MWHFATGSILAKCDEDDEDDIDNDDDDIDNDEDDFDNDEDDNDIGKNGDEDDNDNDKYGDDDDKWDSLQVVAKFWWKQNGFFETNRSAGSSGLTPPTKEEYVIFHRRPRCFKLCSFKSKIASLSWLTEESFSHGALQKTLSYCNVSLKHVKNNWMLALIL